MNTTSAVPPTRSHTGPAPSADPGPGSHPGVGEDPADSPSAARRARLLLAAAILVLCPVAVIGAALSFQSLHTAATPIFGPFAIGFPLLVDMLILGSTLAFLAGATARRPLPGWRWTAHGGVGGTLLLNAQAATGIGSVAWHVTPALVWSVLVEMTARQVTGPGSPNTPASEPIPVRIWISSPVGAGRTWLQMARTGQRSHRQARADLAVHAAAKLALMSALPHRRQRGARRLICRQLRAGALDPAVILGYLRDHNQEAVTDHHTLMIIQSFLDTNPSDRRDSHHASPQDSAPPGPPAALAGGTMTPVAPPREPGTAEHTRSQRSVLSPEHRHRRRQAAVDILRTQPAIDGPLLARELTNCGWPVSRRTAQRILGEASHQMAAQAVQPQTAAALDPPTPTGPIPRNITITQVGGR